MTAAVVLFTRDLRVRDNPALAAGCAGFEYVLPLFVLDPGVAATPNRDRFLAQCLVDLRESLRDRGGDLLLRTGDPAVEAVTLAREAGAAAILLAADASRYARRRHRRLTAAAAAYRLAVHEHPGVTVVPPGDVTPAGRDHYAIFTPYWRAWRAAAWRPVLPAPRRVRLPPGFGGDRGGAVPAGAVPVPSGVAASPGVAWGGETAARRQLSGWRPHAAAYGELHDDMAGDATSRLSPYLHFGCLSARHLAEIDSPEFVRQLCWRDFYVQVLAAFGDLAARAYRFDDPPWRDDRAALADLYAWRNGCTGVPVVDAGMRQLAAEGWMHNRARLITATYLTKVLRLDWRHGLAHYAALLVDADVASNAGNWQWVAGTGNDPRPHRGFNPIRQALRFDPDGDYVRRHVPELAGVPGRSVHRPWRLPRPVPGYPAHPLAPPDAPWL